MAYLPLLCCSFLLLPSPQHHSDSPHLSFRNYISRALLCFWPLNKCMLFATLSKFLYNPASHAYAAILSSYLCYIALPDTMQCDHKPSPSKLLLLQSGFMPVVCRQFLFYYTINSFSTLTKCFSCLRLTLCRYCRNVSIKSTGNQHVCRTIQYEHLTKIIVIYSVGLIRLGCWRVNATKKYLKWIEIWCKLERDGLRCIQFRSTPKIYYFSKL